MNDKDKIQMLEREVARLKKLLAAEQIVSENWRNMYMIRKESMEQFINRLQNLKHE